MVENIRFYMVRNGIFTITELSEKTNVSRVTLSKILNQRVNSVTTRTVDKICSGLKCSPDELMKPIMKDVS